MTPSLWMLCFNSSLMRWLTSGSVNFFPVPPVVSRTIDWQKKESARAGMRRLVKRLLKKHKYPPEGMEDAVQTVMSQCEMWTDAMET